MSTIKFWNKQNNSNNNANQNGKGGSNSTSNGVVNGAENGGKTPGGRNWLHQPDALQNGHVVYLVKFLGNTPVDQPKGIEVVKEAIRKLQFSQQLKKAENGSNYKTKKVEITVSIDGVAIQEPRTNNILHQFPLHKISYCADEKGAKKFFSFIAKTGNSNNSSVPNGDIHLPNGTSNGNSSESEGHECFVFVSNKLASDITLTIGQAFDLAYKRYVNESSKSLEITKLQNQQRQMETTVTAYRQRLRDLSEIVSKNDLERLLVRLGLRDILEVPNVENGMNGDNVGVNGSKTPDLGIDVSTPSNDNDLLIETSPKHFAPIVPPRNLQSQLSSTIEAMKPSVGTKLEGLLLNSDSDSDFDPRAEESDSTTTNGDKITNDLFGFEPPKQSAGQQLFANNNNNNNFTNGFSNLLAPTSSPPPLLAPPPKAAVPRRSNNGLAALNSSGQDLFGSTPFGAAPQTNGFDTGKFYEQNESSSAFENPFNKVADNGNLSGSNIVLSTSNEGVTSLDLTSLQNLTNPSITVSAATPAATPDETICTSFTANLPNAAHHSTPIPNPTVPQETSVTPQSHLDFLTSAGLTQIPSSSCSSSDFVDSSKSALHDIFVFNNFSSPISSNVNPFLQTNKFPEISKYDVFKSINLNTSSATAALPSMSFTSPEMMRKVNEETSMSAVKVDTDLFKDFAASAFNEFKREPAASRVAF